MLAILTTHPIQYQIPLWQALARDGRVPFEVWFLTRHGVESSHDREFGRSFAWDIDTLTGYPSRFLDVAAGATPTSFWACRLKERLRERMKASGTRALFMQGWQVRGYWQAAREAHAIGVEVWLRGESNDLAPTPAWKAPIKRLALERLFKRVDRFLFIGTANRRFYRQWGVAEERLHPAPYAVDNERFARQAAEFRGQREAIRAGWGIRAESRCLLFCGKLIPKKRPLDLVEAAARLRARGRNVHLLFAGSGELEEALRAACAAAGTPATFAGFLNQTQVSRAYVAADQLVLPSDFGETWGLVVNEAMASGLPCVVSDQCGCAEDLASEPPNRIFRGGSVEDLSAALEQDYPEPQSRGASATVTPPSLDATVATVTERYRDLVASTARS